MNPPDLPDHDCFSDDTDATDATKKRVIYAMAALWLLAVVMGARAAGLV